MIPVETLHEIFRLDPETGCLFWRHRPVEHFPSRKEAARWNSRYAGTSALATPGPDGRKRGAIFKRRYPRARVVFAMWFGYWPAELVDHADGNPSNDVPSNLRPASHRQNSQNTGWRRPGTSRFCGVSRLQGRRRNPWVACGRDHNGTQRHIGVFPDEVSAARAYDAAAREWHGAFARLNFPDGETA